MDYRFSPEEEAFRQEVRGFLDREVPADWDFDPFELHDENWEFALAFTKKLAGRGWVAPAWPVEFSVTPVAVADALRAHCGYAGSASAGPGRIAPLNSAAARTAAPRKNSVLSGRRSWVGAKPNRIIGASLLRHGGRAGHA